MDYPEELTGNLGDDTMTVPTDITDSEQVEAGFQEVREVFGPVEILVNYTSGGAWKGLRSIFAAEFEQAFRVSAGGALLCSQAAVEDMLMEGGGTIIFTGATSAVRGRDGAIGFSAAKFVVRGMARSMASELGPEGIHVAFVVIDGQINTPQVQATDGDRDEETRLDLDVIAEPYWHLVTQDRSSWTLELDVRPHIEEF